MNRLDRLTAILIHLQSKRIVRAQELADRFGVSLRTVYRDIRSLEEAGVPLGAEAGIGYFLAEGYHLPPVLFTQEEASVLLLAGKLFEKYSDPDMRRHHDSALYKIRSVLNPADKECVETLHQNVAVYAKPNENGSPGERAVDQVPIAISQSRMISLTYHSSHARETTQREAEPLGLCFYSGHWHLIAYCHLREDYRDFRVDRIQKLHILDRTFNRDQHGSLERLFKIMNKNNELIKIVIRFSDDHLPEIQDQRYYYGFVEEVHHPPFTEMTFLFYSVERFSLWLLGFGSSATVVSPDSLHVNMKNLTTQLSAHYLK